MNPEARLTILFDCCHSGSACELGFIFGLDKDGSVNLIDILKKGAGMVRAAESLFQGGISMTKANDAKMLLGGASDFFNSLHHIRGGADDEGLAGESFGEDWDTEGKDVWMFSGCADDQTSADASIAGAATGAMPWVFIRRMRENPDQSYRNEGASIQSSGPLDINECCQIFQNTSSGVGEQLRPSASAEFWRPLRPGRTAPGMVVSE